MRPHKLRTRSKFGKLKKKSSSRKYGSSDFVVAMTDIEAHSSMAEERRDRERRGIAERGWLGGPG